MYVYCRQVWRSCTLRLFVVMTKAEENPVSMKRLAEEHLEQVGSKKQAALPYLCVPGITKSKTTWIIPLATSSLSGRLFIIRDSVNLFLCCYLDVFRSLRFVFRPPYAWWTCHSTRRQDTFMSILWTRGKRRGSALIFKMGLP